MIIKFKHGLFVMIALLFSVWGHSQTLDFVQGEILVQIESGKRPIDIVRSFGEKHGIHSDIKVLRQLRSPMDIWVFGFNYNEIGESNMLRFLEATEGVKLTQLNHLVKPRATTPNDPLFESQWQWLNDGSVGLKDADVDAELAWDITTGGLTSDGDEIVVAILDDGTDLDHPDLIDNHWVNEDEIPENGIDDDGNGYIDDYNGWNILQDNDNVDNGSHGVLVTGMVGAVGNNEIGVAGINWGVKNMAIKNNFLTDEASVLEAYSYPYIMRKRYNESNGTEGAFVVATNASWGIDGGDPEDSPLWCQFYDSLGVQGILNCGATSNQTINVDLEGDLPTACPSDFMVSVTRSGINDNHGGGYGPINIDLAAPGINIFSTRSGGQYGSSTGTSFSSPLVAGMIALLYATPCPNLTTMAKTNPMQAALEARNLILDNVDNVSGYELLVSTGGRANAHKPLSEIINNCGPCPGPRQVEYSAVDTSSATITWIDGVNSTSANFRYKPVDSTTWTTEIAVSSPFILSDLFPCTEYEIQVQNECLDSMETSDFTASVIFKTDGCCEAPSNLTLVSNSDLEFEISWDSVTIAQSYDLRYKIVDSTNWIEINTTSTSIILTAIEPCQEYEIEVRTNCPNMMMTSFSNPIFVSSDGCGPCLDNDYCVAEGNSNLEYIESVSIAGQLNSSGDNDGYAFFGASPPTLDLASDYTIEIEVGYVGASYDEVAYAYLDANGNGEFESDELLASATMENTISLSFQVPSTVAEGITRLRVVMGYQANPMDACPEVEGEVEDYCVFINDPGLECEFIGAIDSIDSHSENILLSWPSQNLALQYQLRWKNSTLSDWNGVLTTDTFYLLEGLEKCNLYDFQIASVCFNGFSPFTEVQSFMTRCGPSTNTTLITDNFGIEALPNPFSNELIIRIDNNEIRAVNLDLINVLGISVQSKQGIHLVQGINQVSFTGLDELESGVYFLSIDSGKSRKIVQLLKI